MTNTAHQYLIRTQNKKDDLVRAGLTNAEACQFKIEDFDFAFEEKEVVWDEAKTFIERHEWLGKMSLYPTHIFTARYNGELAGVVVMDMPTAFSKLLGNNTRKMERLIARGACISWSPKNLASSLIMYSVRWMVVHTDYRLFVGYSDSEAGEIGTIYQACNFYYLGAKFGSKKQFKVGEDKWVSDRYFRSRSAYKRVAKDLGIVWDDSWQERDRVIFDKMPEADARAIKDGARAIMQSCEVRNLPPKGKYAYVLGRDKRETKKLRKQFEARNKTFDYPKR